MSSNLFQKRIPLAILSIMGILSVVSYYFPFLGLKGATDLFVKWTVIIGAIALWMGSISIAIYYLNKIRKKVSNDWPYAIWTLITMLITIVLAIVYDRKGIYLTWNTSTITAVQSAILSLQTVYVFSGAFRSWRIYRLEAYLLIGTMIIVFFAQSPIGPVFIPGIQYVKSYIGETISTGATRGMLIGSAVGGIILSLRTLMGREPGVLVNIEEGG